LRRLQSKYVVVIVGAFAVLLVAGCGDGGSSPREASVQTVTQTVEVQVDATSATYPSADDVGSWKRKWCSTKLGMTRDELIRIMGEPTIDLPDTTHWGAFEWKFTAKLKADGRAYNLGWIDATHLPKADVERGELPCNWIRTSG
jgi:hypothetical protein